MARHTSSDVDNLKWKMEGPLFSQGDDEAVQSTTDDAASSKWSAVNHGYFEDPYVQHFVPKFVRRAPLIHRGYYSRVAAIRKTIQDFINSLSASSQFQIVNLGAGLDTTYFWMKDHFTNFLYFEVDFPEIIRRKASAILRRPELWSKIVDSKESLGSMKGWEIRGPSFKMVSTDLRKLGNVEDNLKKAGFNPDLPTLFVCECVLVYLPPVHSDALIKWASSAVNSVSAIVVYEQTNPHDPFGKVMVNNLAARGCPLLGILEYASIESQVKRYLTLGWQMCSVLNMNDIYDFCIDQEDRRRVERLELFDELEEWRLIQAHYIVVVSVSNSTVKNGAAETLDHFWKCWTPRLAHSQINANIQLELPQCNE